MCTVNLTTTCFSCFAWLFFLFSLSFLAGIHCVSCSLFQWNSKNCVSLKEVLYLILAEKNVIGLCSCMLLLAFECYSEYPHCQDSWHLIESLCREAKTHRGQSLFLNKLE